MKKYVVTDLLEIDEILFLKALINYKELNEFTNSDRLREIDLSHAFKWHLTNEGYDFWATIHFTILEVLNK